jgi:EAL domain-containing protein (putative c-di-GMP-specific phosphodiesterase class I)
MNAQRDAAPALRAVLVDSSSTDLDTAIAQCRLAGIAVNGWADSGAAALELIESLPAPPDLVVMELDLPDMDGADLLQALSMLEPGLPIIIASRHSARLHDAALRGAEGLIRWRHPQHGLLSPDCFLPQTEAANLVDVLTMEVARMALQDWKRWHANGMSLPISINLSPLSLSDPHLAEELMTAVNQAGVPPRAITFEIIEHEEIADLATALRILIKLRMHGFGLALDDYGAGHASMLQLSRFPFTEVKLDRRLIHGASRRPHMVPQWHQKSYEML